MNKTVNINLAGIFFHIDEDAYKKLQHYLEAIKRSFKDPQGRNEIIADIEARIAELFNERVQNNNQVVSIKEVDDIITIMGQPEDYIVDEEIFEDESSPSNTNKTTSGTYRKLFRDVDNSYIGGVSAGLSHYFGIDALWIRLIWTALFFGAGTGILVYIILWVLMPAAETTADKLAMSGKQINITNIEEKVKEGFSSVKDSIEGVADKVKNGDYHTAGNHIKTTSRSFFDALGNLVMFFFKIIAKFIGIILIMTSAMILVGLIIGLLSVGVSEMFHFPGLDFEALINATNLPIWTVSLLVLFAVGIPFFFLFILGIKILVNNSKSLGKVANFALIGLWIASVITLSVFAAREAIEYKRVASVTNKSELNIKANDTLYVTMVGNNMYSKNINRDYDFDIVYDENDTKKIYSSNLRLIVRSTKEPLAYLSIEKSARGSTYQNAKHRADDIAYNYTLEKNTLQLDAYFLTDYSNKYRDQDIEVILYLPEKSILYAHENTYSFHRNSSSYRDILDNEFEGHFMKVIHNDLLCLDCQKDKNYKLDINIKKEDTAFKIDENSIDIKGRDGQLKLDKNGFYSESESIITKIDSSGVSIKSKDNN
ncbi:MAG: PspC domain-containing protein [Flavobacteriaceae bacterium]|nr:PspC domain-containing protein [Flavobacteriaceae bacterium]